MRFVKGHGTENDFVLLPHGEGPAELEPGLVRALCDRRAGIGADGVLRVMAADEPGRNGADVRWFMDYRNADGSLAEMCGNGIRVFARYLVDSGHERAGPLRIATRAGVRHVDVPAVGDITVDMGQATKLPDAKVRLDGRWWTGAGWSLGNPHLVVTDVDITELALCDSPVFDPPDVFPDGANVEFVESVGPGQLRMRVVERGVGETRSCGTGACAAAVAVMASRRERTVYQVDVPGGRLRVEWRPDGTVALAGPAVLVAKGEYLGDGSA